MAAPPPPGMEIVTVAEVTARRKLAIGICALALYIQANPVGVPEPATA